MSRSLCSFEYSTFFQPFVVLPVLVSTAPLLLSAAVLLPPAREARILPLFAAVFSSIEKYPQRNAQVLMILSIINQCLSHFLSMNFSKLANFLNYSASNTCSYHCLRTPGSEAWIFDWTIMISSRKESPSVNDYMTDLNINIKYLSEGDRFLMTICKRAGSETLRLRSCFPGSLQ